MKAFGVCLLLVGSMAVSGASNSSVSQVSRTAIAGHPSVPKLAPGQRPGLEASYDSQGQQLRGVLYLPSSRGIWPAVLWNHGADKNPNTEPELAAFYNRNGYALFVPFRSGHGGSPGRTVDELLAPHDAADVGDAVQDQRFVSLLTKAAQDTKAALAWLSSNQHIDKTRMFMSGVSYGGLECLIDADSLSGVRGYIIFSGGARLFGNRVLAERLTKSVRGSRAPVLLIQAQNDYSTTPTKVLGPLLRQRKDGSGSILYPAFGDPKSIPMGHIAFATWSLGAAVWGADVLNFMHSVEHRQEPSGGSSRKPVNR